MTKPKLFKEGIFVASYALVSKAMGVVREIAMAYFFGASGVVDAYRIALTAVLLPVDTLGGSALGNSFIPTFKHLLTGRKSRLGWLLANQVLIVFVFGAVVVTLILMLFPGLAVRVVAPGFDPSRLEDASLLTAVLAPMMPFFAGALLIGFVLNSLYRFRIPALQPMIQNVGLLMGIVVAAVVGSLVPLSLGMVVAYVVFAVLLVVVVRKHWIRMGWRFKRRDSRVWRYFLSAYAPLLLLSLILHGNILVDRMVSSLLVVGSVASLEYARFIVDTPMVTLGLGMVRVALPHFSDLEAQGKRGEMIALLERLLFGSLIWLLPLSLFFGMVSEPIIRLIYGYGKFGQDAIVPTASALGGFSVGMWAAFGCYLMHRVYNAQRRNGILAIFCAIGLSVNTILNIELGPRIGVQGIAIATSIANCLLFLLLLIGIGWESFRKFIVQGGYLIGGIVILRYLLDYIVPRQLPSLLILIITGAVIIVFWMIWVVVNPTSRRGLMYVLRRREQ